MQNRSMYITPISWPSKYVGENSAMGSSAYLRSLESQLQQENSSFSVGMKHQWQPEKAAFSEGCPTYEARGGSAYMKQNASLSNVIEPQWQSKKAAFLVGSNRELEKGINQVDKETRSVIHEECKEFGKMFREKLQEFAMILIKKYHYNFSVEYFDDYHGSFNKEEFLGVKHPKEETRVRTTDSLPTLNFGQKKKHCDGGNSDQKDGCNIESNFGGEKHNLKENYNEQIDRAANAEGSSDIAEKEVQIEGNCSQQKRKEVLDGNAFGILQQDQSTCKEEGEEEEEESKKKKLEDGNQSIDSLSSTLTSAETLGQESINEQSLAGSEVAASPNVNALKQPWYEYSRKEYKPPLLHFEAAVDISSAKHGCGLNGDIVTTTMAEDLPFLLVLDGYEVFSIEILGQFILGINLGNLRMKMKRPKGRKKERRMIRIEKVGIG